MKPTVDLIRQATSNALLAYGALLLGRVPEVSEASEVKAAGQDDYGLSCVEPHRENRT